MLAALRRVRDVCEGHLPKDQERHEALQAGPAGSGCSTFTPAQCCSGVCHELLFDGGRCGQGAAKECRTASDCVSGHCVGYRCQDE